MARIEGFSPAHMKMIEKQLEPFIKQAMEKVARDLVVRKVMESVDWFYSQYTPGGDNPYQRRGESGGLRDASNVDVKWYGDTLHVRNTAKTNASVGHDMGMVDQYVIPGDRYTWQSSNIYSMQPFPRDFYTKAVEFLVSGAEYRNAVKKELSSLGIMVV